MECRRYRAAGERFGPAQGECGENGPSQSNSQKRVTAPEGSPAGGHGSTKLNRVRVPPAGTVKTVDFLRFRPPELTGPALRVPTRKIGSAPHTFKGASQLELKQDKKLYALAASFLFSLFKLTWLISVRIILITS